MCALLDERSVAAESRSITRSSIRLHNEVLDFPATASRSRTIADLEILRSLAEVVISAKSGSGSFTVSVFMPEKCNTTTAVSQYQRLAQTRPDGSPPH